MSQCLLSSMTMMKMMEINKEMLLEVQKASPHILKALGLSERSAYNASIRVSNCGMSDGDPLAYLTIDLDEDKVLVLPAFIFAHDDVHLPHHAAYFIRCSTNQN